MPRWEQLLCVFFLLVAVATTVPAYFGFQANRYDQQALEDLQALRDAMYRDSEQLFLVAPGASVKFPTTGEEIVIRSGVRVSYLVRLKRFHNSITILSTYHPQGKHEYRWVDIYGNRRLQKIVRASA